MFYLAAKVYVVVFLTLQRHGVLPLGLIDAFVGLALCEFELVSEVGLTGEVLIECLVLDTCRRCSSRIWLLSVTAGAWVFRSEPVLGSTRAIR